MKNEKSSYETGLVVETIKFVWNWLRLGFRWFHTKNKTSSYETDYVERIKSLYDTSYVARVSQAVDGNL